MVYQEMQEREEGQASLRRLLSNFGYVRFSLLKAICVERIEMVESLRRIAG